MDDADRLACSGIVCARGGHFACHDLPPPLPKPRLLGCGHDEGCQSVLGHCRACDVGSVAVSEG